MSAQLLLKGTRVRYMGLEAVVIRDNDNTDEMWRNPNNAEPTLRFVTIEFTSKTPHGWSKIQDVFASACTVI